MLNDKDYIQDYYHRGQDYHSRREKLSSTLNTQGKMRMYSQQINGWENY